MYPSTVTVSEPTGFDKVLKYNLLELYNAENAQMSGDNRATEKNLLPIFLPI